MSLMECQAELSGVHSGLSQSVDKVEARKGVILPGFGSTELAAGSRRVDYDAL